MSNINLKNISTDDLLKELDNRIESKEINLEGLIIVLQGKQNHRKNHE